MLILILGTLNLAHGDSKITELPELTVLADEDLLIVVDDPSGSPATKKVTIGNLQSGIDHTLITSTGTNIHTVIDSDLFDLDASTISIRADLDSVIIDTGTLSASTTSLRTDLDAVAVSTGINSDAIVLNTTHRGSDGTDHSFIDQDVTISATPTFSSMTVTFGVSAGSFTTTGAINGGSLAIDEVILDGDGSDGWIMTPQTTSTDWIIKGYEGAVLRDTLMWDTLGFLATPKSLRMGTASTVMLLMSGGTTSGGATLRARLSASDSTRKLTINASPLIFQVASADKLTMTSTETTLDQDLIINGDLTTTGKVKTGNFEVTGIAGQTDIMNIFGGDGINGDIIGQPIHIKAGDNFDNNTGDAIRASSSTLEGGRGSDLDGLDGGKGGHVYIKGGSRGAGFGGTTWDGDVFLQGENIRVQTKTGAVGKLIFDDIVLEKDGNFLRIDEGGIKIRDNNDPISFQGETTLNLNGSVFTLDLDPIPTGSKNYIITGLNTMTLSGDLTTAGDITTTGSFVADSDINGITYGDDQDLKTYHNGTDLLTDVSNTGTVYFYKGTLIETPAANDPLGVSIQKTTGGRQRAAYFYAKGSSGGAPGIAMQGLNAFAEWTGSTNCASVIGGLYGARVNAVGGGNITEQITAVRGTLNVAADTAITIAAANMFESILFTLNDSDVTITALSGLKLGDMSNSAGTVDEAYGINMGDVTAGTANWAIKTGLGLVDFGDDVTIVGDLTASSMTVTYGISAGSITITDVGTFGGLRVDNNATPKLVLLTSPAGVTDPEVHLIEANAFGGKLGDASTWGFKWQYESSTNELRLYSGNQTTVVERLSVGRDSGDFDFNAGDLLTTGIIRGGGYKSGDGTVGITQSETGVTSFDIEIKNGLITLFIKN